MDSPTSYMWYFMEVCESRDMHVCIFPYIAIYDIVCEEGVTVYWF